VEGATGRRVLLGGFPVLDVEILSASAADARLFLYAAIPAIFLVLFVLVRRVAAVLLSFLVVGLALLFTFGLYVAAGHKFGILTAILPVLVLGIGMAQSVHVLVHYYEELAAGHGRRRALARTIRLMGRPCLFTSLTTAVGLGSFMVADIPVLRMTGLYGALGVLISFVLTLTLLPALLSFLPPPAAVARRRYRGGWLTARLDGLTRFDVRRRRGILAGAVVLLGLAGLGAARVSTETTWLHMLRRSDPVRQVTEAIERHMGGVDNLEFLIEGPPGSLLEPAQLRRLERLAAFAAAQPGVSRVASVLDYVKEINQALHADDPRHHRIPPTREAVAQGLLLYEMSGGAELERMISVDYAAARIMVLVETMSTRESAALSDTLRAFAREALALDIVPTGHVTVMGEMEAKVFRGQIRSLTVAALLITLCMVVLLRSARLGLVSMLPNALPIAMMFGTMGWFAIPLDITTVIIAGLALGIAVDDTIHYMTRVRRELDAGHGYTDAIRRANRTIARAVVATSVILCAGFLTFTLGTFEGSFYFGVLSALTMLYALAGDLVLLPALLLVLRPIRPRARPAPARAGGAGRAAGNQVAAA
jgi:predicted RND superfamily exporter protein